MEEIILNLTNGALDNLNYGWVILFMAIESSFIPFPSEVVMIPAAYMAAETGEMSYPMIILCGTLGALIGALINYGLAYSLGRPIVYAFANSRFGHMCLIDAEKVEKAEAYFDKRGAISTLIGRMIPAIRQLISIPCRIGKDEPAVVLPLHLSGCRTLEQHPRGHRCGFPFDDAEAGTHRHHRTLLTHHRHRCHRNCAGDYRIPYIYIKE